MAGSSVILRESREAWTLLQQGVICAFKAKNYPINGLISKLHQNVIEELNERYHDKLWRELNESKLAFGVNKHLVDYSRHPLVIGPGYKDTDMEIRPVHTLAQRVSGLTILTVNDNRHLRRLRQARMLRTYRVTATFGKATDTGFADGKVYEKTSNRFLKRSHIDKALAAVQSNHTRKAFEKTGVCMQSQQAYEIAAKGPARLAMGTNDPIVYSIKCLHFSNPDIELEINCVNERADYLAQLIGEIAHRLNTSAVVEHARCIRYGCFTLDHALLVRDFSVATVIDNMLMCERLLADNKHVTEIESDHVKRARTKVPSWDKVLLERGQSPNEEEVKRLE